MSVLQRYELDEVLATYTAQNPKLATLDGDEFIIKPRRFGPLMMIAGAIALLTMLLFVVLGVFVVTAALVSSTVESPVTVVLIGLSLIVFGGGIIFFVVLTRLSRGIIDLRTGDYKIKSLFGTRTLVNMADVDSYNRVDQKMQNNAGGATVNVVCQIRATVPGKKGPKTTKLQLAVFNKAQAFTDFEPVVNALIGYFRSNRNPAGPPGHRHG